MNERVTYGVASWADRTPEEWAADGVSEDDFKGVYAPIHVICRFRGKVVEKFIHVQYWSEPEDANLDRDFSWIFGALSDAYAAGRASK